MTAVDELLAIEQIKALKSRYFRCVDLKLFDEWRTCFSDDAQLHASSTLPDGGVDGFVAAVACMLEGVRTIHHGHNHEIEITSPTTARGTWALQDYVEWPAADGRRVGFTGYGFYSEEYRKESGGWKICWMRLRYVRVDALVGEPLPVVDGMLDMIVSAAELGRAAQPRG
jgi:hypothetical protein